jgi:H+-transporting ATPase
LGSSRLSPSHPELACSESEMITGLSAQEAAKRLAQLGPNSVTEEREHWLRSLALHLWAPVPWMLEVTIALQIAVGKWTEALMITALLLFNVAIGVIQKTRANAALELLKQRLSLTARVKRDGEWLELAASELVPGDVVQLSLGKIVPADARILQGSVLLDQSILTGESLAIDVATGQTVYAGALVRRGEAIANVTATGTSTYFGRTAELVRIAHVESSEIKVVLGLVRNLTIVNVALVLGLAAYGEAIALPTREIILLILTAMLSAVPVALPATFTLAAALGAKRLALKGVLLTRLAALNEAAMIDVVCADKTGTLTENTLAVAKVEPVSEGWTPGDVLGFAALASSVDGQDLVDVAIRAAAHKTPPSHPLPRLVSFTPFDPAAKLSQATAIYEGQRELRISKGAPAAIAKLAAQCPETD